VRRRQVGSPRISQFNVFRRTFRRQKGQVQFQQEGAAASSLGGHTGNHLAAAATVNSEILVGRKDAGIGKGFGPANEASIGEAHGHVGILPYQLHDWVHEGLLVRV
jgi:hypothetical protein